MTADDALVFHRLQFAFTIVYHYLFPQLTMGLALLIVVMKAVGLRPGFEHWNDAARFWIRIFGINFAVGVVTGIPMEFQFGTNWAEFAGTRAASIGPDPRHGGALRLLPRVELPVACSCGASGGSRRVGHFLAAVALFVGSWLSGYFIIATNAFMQHPVGHAVGRRRHAPARRLLGVRAEPVGHRAVRAQHGRGRRHRVVRRWPRWAPSTRCAGAIQAARLFLRVGAAAGLVASVLVAFPTGDAQAKLVARHQPVRSPPWKGRFESGPRAGLNSSASPTCASGGSTTRSSSRGALASSRTGRSTPRCRASTPSRETDWPDNIELLYYAFHIMAGLGTLFIAPMALAAVLLSWRGRLERSRPMLWILMLAFPFPYIANTAGWMTAELGRQPWLIYGLLRTARRGEPTVHSGTVLFTLIGFCGLYLVLGLLFLFLVGREIAHGPGRSSRRARGRRDRAWLSSGTRSPR